MDTFVDVFFLALSIALTGFVAFIWWRSRKPSPPSAPHSYTWTKDNTTVEALRDLAKQMARPTLLLTPAETAAFSKIGGEPELAPDMNWPMGAEGPRPFLAQIDLFVVRSAGGPDWLPPEGAIYAFMDDTRFGLGDEVSVRFSPVLGSATERFPDALPKKQRFKERRVALQHAISIPSVDWLDLELGALSDALEEELGLPSRDNPDHRVGGYPAQIQAGRLNLECEHLSRGLPGSVYDDETTEDFLRAAEEWRLLLQIDYDAELGIKYADGGMFYIFIREDDARAADFSKTITISHTY